MWDIKKLVYGTFPDFNTGRVHRLSFSVFPEEELDKDGKPQAPKKHQVSILETPKQKEVKASIRRDLGLDDKLQPVSVKQNFNDEAINDPNYYKEMATIVGSRTNLGWEEI
jgi:hypothetical protein